MLIIKQLDPEFAEYLSNQRAEIKVLITQHDKEYQAKIKPLIEFAEKLEIQRSKPSSSKAAAAIKPVIAVDPAAAPGFKSDPEKPKKSFRQEQDEKWEEEKRKRAPNRKDRTKRPPRKRKHVNEDDGVCDKEQMIAAKNRKRNEDVINRVWELRQQSRPKKDPIPDPIGETRPFSLPAPLTFSFISKPLFPIGFFNFKNLNFSIL